MSSSKSRITLLQVQAVSALVSAACILFPASFLGVCLMFWVLAPIFCVVEIVVFPAVFFFKYRRLNRQSDVISSNYNPREAFDRFVSNASSIKQYVSLEGMICKWFGGVPFKKVKRGNVADLMTYGFWYKSRDQMEKEGLGHVPDQLAEELEQAFDLKLEEGRDPDLSFMAHLWQDVRCHYRPLSFYLGIELIFMAKHLLMLGAGFKSFTMNGYTYYTYGFDAQHQMTVDRTPILFLHGVGLGLLPYITFVLRLAASGHPVIAVECNHLGMRWVDVIPTADQVVDVLLAVMDSIGAKRVAAVGHSYGTFMASRLVQRHPERVQSLSLIDPVCFIMFEGKLIKNFVYRPHDGALTTWLVARDLHHAMSVCRGFFWSQLNLWPEHLPEKCLVVLSGKDTLVPVEETMKMLALQRPDIPVLLHKEHCHADFIKDLKWQDKLVEQVIILASPSGDMSEGGKCEKNISKDSVDAAHIKTTSPNEASVRRSERLRAKIIKTPEISSKKASYMTLRSGEHGRSDSANSWERQHSNVAA